MNAEGHVEICKMISGKKRTPIYWKPFIDEKYKNKVTDVSHFNTVALRNQFEITNTESNIIFGHLKKKTEPEGNAKFFKIKKHINTSLLTEMDISDTKNQFIVEFEDDVNEFTNHTLVCGSTNSGKSYWVVNMILENLKSKHKRNFIIFSSEWKTDKTLDRLKREEFEEYITGVGISERDIKESEYDNAEDYFNHEVKLRSEHAKRGTILVFDDFQDSAFPTHMRRFLNRGLRVFRHEGISIIMILHSLRSGNYSSTAYNSIKWLVLFPRSQKAKIIAFLNQDLGMTLKNARKITHRFAQQGRTMICRIHAPECFIGNKLVKLI